MMVSMRRIPNCYHRHCNTDKTEKYKYEKAKELNSNCTVHIPFIETGRFWSIFIKNLKGRRKDKTDID